jgi:hypothetical protein
MYNSPITTLTISLALCSDASLIIEYHNKSHNIVHAFKIDTIIVKFWQELKAQILKYINKTI